MTQPKDPVLEITLEVAKAFHFEPTTFSDLAERIRPHIQDLIREEVERHMEKNQ